MFKAIRKIIFGNCSMQLAGIAANALRFLPSESIDHIAGFVNNSQNPDGGFRGRAQSSDLYYTLFAMESLSALNQNLCPEKIAGYLTRAQNPETLDFVHLSCLARCLEKLPRSLTGSGYPEKIMELMERHRYSNRGYRLSLDSNMDSIYASFLALITYTGAGRKISSPAGLIKCTENLRTPDQGYADQPGVASGTTTVTAAAVMLLFLLEQPVPPGAGDWIMSRFCPEGGFLANPGAPVPDLLSTATALLALRAMNYPLNNITQACLNFVENLWTESGGFTGHAFDTYPDCEYTFYGLLSLWILLDI